MSKNDGALSKEFLTERDTRIFKLRQAGVTQSEIAKRFNMSTRAVTNAVRRQLERFSSEALMAYPELLRMELERLDSLQAAIWPMTQHRRVTMDDGNEVQVEPDFKAIQQVLAIMDRRTKLLGMEQTNVNVQMDVNSRVDVRSTLSGAITVSNVHSFSPEAEARKLLEIMGRTGVLPANIVNEIMGVPLAINGSPDDELIPVSENADDLVD